MVCVHVYVCDIGIGSKGREQALKQNRSQTKLFTVEIVVLDPKIFLHVKFGHLNVF